MHADIEGLSQVLSFKNGEVQNQLLLKLPDGRVVQAIVDADTAAYVAGAFVSHGGAAAQRAVAAAGSASHGYGTPSSTTEMEGNFSPVKVESDSDEFGGNYGTNANDAASEWEAAAETPVDTTPVVLRKGHLRVSADAKGNPVIQGANVVDNAEFVGGIGAAEEEDGVGSV